MKKTHTNIEDSYATYAALTTHYGHNKYRELHLGEKIEEGDVFYERISPVHKATDVGNGIYSPDHFPHFRLINT